MAFSTHDQLKSVLPHDRYDTFQPQLGKQESWLYTSGTQDRNATTETVSIGHRHADLENCMLLHTG